MLALLLDNIQKTMNTGALVRLAAAANTELQLAGASLHHSRRSARKASVGAEERARIVYPGDFLEAAVELKNRGFRLVAACARAERLYTEEDYSGPTAFLLGSEVAGLSAEAKALADVVVRLPMVGELESLNVGMTAGVLLYEALRQRNQAGCGSPENELTVRIRPVVDADRPWVEEIIRGWGADFIVSRLRKIYPAQLPGLIAETADGRKVGLLTYEITGDQCEIVTIDSFDRFLGVGTGLLQAMQGRARQMGCRRLWLVTTNDNLDAIRFYYRRGFVMGAVHTRSWIEARKIKPQIPEAGNCGIPIVDELEFEMELTSSSGSPD